VTTSSYYLWKWADNDLPGQPNEVYSELLHGRMHPTIQAFDPAPAVRQLELISVQGRQKGEEWDWQIHQIQAGRLAAFIFLTCPAVQRYGQMRSRFCNALLHLDISGYDEERGQLMYCFCAKKNSWEYGLTDDIFYDVTEADLPDLLSRIRPDGPRSSVVLENRQNHFVQCGILNRRFTVEWRENYDLSDLTKFGQWRAGYFESIPGRPRLFVPAHFGNHVVNKNCEVVYREVGKTKHELIRYTDTLRIFRAFLRSEPRPPEYHWQDIKDELP
jgi:hypothetical protein